MEKKNKTERIYRMFADLEVEKRADGDQEPESYLVKGYATTFDDPYVIWEYDGIKYFEQIDRNALNDADMTDVIFLYNHEGMVYARQKNGSLDITTDDHGLLVEADLSGTKAARDMYEAIDSGLIDQMSFAFTVKDDELDRETHTRIIHRIGKVFDVSAVSIPANPGTDIAAVSARSYFDGVIEAERAERLAREKALELAKAKYNYMEVKHD